MAQKKRKGQEGAAVEYITRPRALRKLQLSLSDFRRLCILKGIYPRDLKRKNRVGGSGSNKKTIYLAKDISFLSHEPLLAKFRTLQAFHKRLRRYVGRRDWTKVRSLEKHVKPEIKLDHLVRERYPTFSDALRDLDDPLSMLALFSTLPRTEEQSHQAETAAECARLLREFEAYVMATGGLRKAFISIKGIYYQAEVLGVPITWVVPHEFATPVPTDVDFKVMLTFLDFYRTLMRFVNYRLFARLGWPYPSSAAAGGGFVAEDEQVVLASALPPIEARDEIFPGGEQRPLAGSQIFISREVPLKMLAFVLQCMGATISFPRQQPLEETDGKEGGAPPALTASLLNEDDPSLTHQIVDRPALSRMFVGREYVQPQWVFDSLNAGQLLDMAPYRMGASLPPHLSPFVNEQEEEEEEQEGEEEMMEEQEEEVAVGKGAASGKKGPKGEKKAQKELAVAMLSKSKQKLYRMMQHSRQQKADAKQKLKTKRAAIASAKTSPSA